MHCVTSATPADAVPSSAPGVVGEREDQGITGHGRSGVGPLVVVEWPVPLGGVEHSGQHAQITGGAERRDTRRRQGEAHPSGDGSGLEAIQCPRVGAGLLSSLVDTDGRVDLGEEITVVEPGQTVGFLSYASLL